MDMTQEAENYSRALNEIESAKLGQIPAPKKTDVEYHVKIPLPDGVNWFLLCRCESFHSLISIVEALFNRGNKGPQRIQIEEYRLGQ